VPRDERLDEPSPEAVRAAARATFDSTVDHVTPIDKGVNALYRIEFRTGERGVLKAPTVATDEEFLVEPALLDLIGRDTAVPVPQVLAQEMAVDGPLDVACYVMEHLEGREIQSLVDLPSSVRERLLREAGAHLAAIHELRITDSYGRLHVVDGDLTVQSPVQSWNALFEDLVGEITAGLLGDGLLTDANPRFADLEPTIRETLTDFHTAVDGSPPPPAIVMGDYRPANLLVASHSDADPIVRGVFDIGGPGR